MFVRKKNNKSGVISIQVIGKPNGKYKLLKTIGSSSDPEVTKHLYHLGLEWIDDERNKNQKEFDFSDEEQLLLSALNQIDSITESGTDALLGKIFDEIGFNVINDELFRLLVLSRLTKPGSKLNLTNYLSVYKSREYDVWEIYRYLDKFESTYKDKVQDISYNHTVKILGGEIHILFYDVTTLYFETDQMDELRVSGFSKEGRHQNPQILLGLLVSIGGYPLAYEIHAGNKFEGKTMLPIIESFKSKYKLEQLIIIADSGLLSKQNIKDLQSKGYEYILGARIKSETDLIKKQILELEIKSNQSVFINKDEYKRLLVSYSESRAKKDKHNRERGLKKLEKQIVSGKLTKSNINNRGYNKFLHLEGQIQVEIDKQKIMDDIKWDGLKGFVTNTRLSNEEIIANYAHLWNIEKAFRVVKSELEVRPIYHRLERRIQAHICIAFVSYKVYKELERQLKLKGSKLSPTKAIEIAKSIFTIQAKTSCSKKVVKRTLLMNNDQKYLADLFNLY